VARPLLACQRPRGPLMSSGERRGARETIDRMTRRLVDSGKGQRTHEQARAIAVRAARDVIHGKKSPKGGSR